MASRSQETPPSLDYLRQLPQLMLERVFLYLPPESLATMYLVCKRFHPVHSLDWAAFAGFTDAHLRKLSVFHLPRKDLMLRKPSWQNALFNFMRKVRPRAGDFVRKDISNAHLILTSFGFASPDGVPQIDVTNILEKFTLFYRGMAQPNADIQQYYMQQKLLWHFLIRHALHYRFARIPAAASDMLAVTLGIPATALDMPSSELAELGVHLLAEIAKDDISQPLPEHFVRFLLRPFDALNVMGKVLPKPLAQGDFLKAYQPFLATQKQPGDSVEQQWYKLMRLAELLKLPFTEHRGLDWQLSTSYFTDVLHEEISLARPVSRNLPHGLVFYTHFALALQEYYSAHTQAQPTSECLAFIAIVAACVIKNSKSIKRTPINNTFFYGLHLIARATLSARLLENVGVPHNDEIIDFVTQCYTDIDLNRLRLVMSEFGLETLNMRTAAQQEILSRPIAISPRRSLAPNRHSLGAMQRRFVNDTPLPTLTSPRQLCKQEFALFKEAYQSHTAVENFVLRLAFIHFRLLAAQYNLPFAELLTKGRQALSEIEAVEFKNDEIMAVRKLYDKLGWELPANFPKRSKYARRYSDPQSAPVIRKARALFISSSSSSSDDEQPVRGSVSTRQAFFADAPAASSSYDSLAADVDYAELTANRICVD